MTQMLKEGSLETNELVLVVNVQMHDGSTYTGQILESQEHQWYKNNLKQPYKQ